MTKIKYTKERLNSSLKMSKFFIGFGLFFVLISFVYKDWNGISPLAIGIGEIGGGVLMFFVYLYKKKHQYLTIEDGELIMHTLFSKKIKLSDVISTKEFAGDIVLKTEKGEFAIDTQIIDTESLEVLKNKLEIE